MTNRRTFLKTSLAGLPLLAQEVKGQRRASAIYKRPVVVSTWDTGMSANAAAWKVLARRGRAIDAVEAAARAAEDETSCCVGLDAYPDRDGFVTLDASIMDDKANCGSVVFLQHIKHPVSVAR